MSQPFIVDDSSPDIQYNVQWHINSMPSDTHGGTAHLALGAGASFTYTFFGQRVEVYGSLSPSDRVPAQARFSINGQNTDWTASYTGQPQHRTLFYSSPNLPGPGPHRLTVTNSVDDDVFMFDYLFVIPAAPVRPPSYQNQEGDGRQVESPQTSNIGGGSESTQTDTNSAAGSTETRTSSVADSEHGTPPSDAATPDRPNDGNQHGTPTDSRGAAETTGPASGSVVVFTPTGNSSTANGLSGSQATSKSEVNIGAVVGGVLGGLMIILLVLLIIVVARRKKRIQREQYYSESEEAVSRNLAGGAPLSRDASMSSYASHMRVNPANHTISPYIIQAVAPAQVSRAPSSVSYQPSVSNVSSSIYPEATGTTTTGYPKDEKNLARYTNAAQYNHAYSDQDAAYYDHPPAPPPPAYGAESSAGPSSGRSYDG